MLLIERAIHMCVLDEARTVRYDGCVVRAALAVPVRFGERSRDMPMPTTDNKTPEQTSQKLFICGQLTPTSHDDTTVDVCRGMTVRAREGHDIGYVAAVVTDVPTAEVTHVILGYCHSASDYRLTPVALVSEVDDDTVRLRVSAQEAAHLPNWHTQ